MKEVDRSDELVVTSSSKDSNGPLFDRDVTVLEPKRGWASLDLRHLWDYRELLFFLTWRDILLRYKQAVLGVAWAIMQPLLTMVVFTVVFNKGLKVETGDKDLPYAVFSFCGLLPWQFFAGALTRSTTSVVGNANLVTKVYFPRLVIPISAVLGVLVDFVLSFIVLLILMAGYGIAPGWEIAVLPAFVVLTIATALSVGLWMSAINVLYRDVQYIIPFLVQLWMFISPVIYRLDPEWPEWLRVLFSLNPMTGVINGFRWSLLGSPFDARYLGISTAVVVVLLVGGLFYFRRIERMFADVV